MNKKSKLLILSLTIIATLIILYIFYVKVLGPRYFVDICGGFAGEECPEGYICKDTSPESPEPMSDEAGKCVLE